jgi:hypothetical protein
MKKSAAIHEDSIRPGEDKPQAALADPGSPGLETRVCRLEDAVASLQDTQPMEERIVERVSSRLEDRSGSLLRTGRRLLPAAIGVLNAQADIVHQPASPLSEGSRAKWFLIEIYAEARLVVRMYLDRRYRMSWAGLVIPPILIVAIAVSWYWLPGTSLPVLGTIVDKSVDLLLAFVVFKVLSREARRYRVSTAQQYQLPAV